jgi:hypothetical protein
MATELRKVPTTDIEQTRFFGGKDRGTCIQITQRKEQAITEYTDKFFNKVQLTREEARLLAQELLMFANQQEIESVC